MVTVSMMGVLLAFASLNGSRFLGQLRLNNATRQVVTDLRLARAKAIEQGTLFRVVFAGGSAYTVERRNPTSLAWEPHALYGKAQTAGSAQTVSLPPPVSTSSDTVIFRPRGSADTVHQITVSDPAVAAGTRTVNVSLAGRIAIQ
jgi:Tfp pilus assembly protein FimT